jgi:hypothetical protein
MTSIERTPCWPDFRALGILTLAAEHPTVNRNSPFLATGIVNEKLGCCLEKNGETVYHFALFGYGNLKKYFSSQRSSQRSS